MNISGRPQLIDSLILFILQLINKSFAIAIGFLAQMETVFLSCSSNMHFSSLFVLLGCELFIILETFPQAFFLPSLYIEYPLGQLFSFTLL